MENIMIADYIADSAEQPGGGRNGMRPADGVWGTVLKPSDATGKGRVRVKVKTMKEGMDTFESVPVLTGYGGESCGAFFLPEEGDIVRLDFVGGDFRHPVVAGSVFPQDSPFVEENADRDNSRKACRLKNGSEISFSGEKGKDKIRICGSGQMSWELDEEAQQIASGDKENKNRLLLDKKNGSAQLTAESSIRLSCGKSAVELKQDGTMVLECVQLTLKAKNVKLQGSAKVQLEGQELSLNGTTGVALTGKGQVKIDSKGQLKLSGAVIQLN